jgi:ribose transport system substrate-binding protein
MAELYKGNYTEPPTTSPPGAKGKSVWWISCGQALPSCSEPAAVAAQAAKALGIDFHIADAKLNVAGAGLTAIRTALAAKPDAIVEYGLGCESMQGALEDAKTQGVPVLGLQVPDCSDNGGPHLFTIPEIYNTDFQDSKAFWEEYGRYSADYAIAASGGKAKLIISAGADPNQVDVTNGFTQELKKCSGCSIVATVKYATPDLVPNGPWIQAFRAALVQHPEATAVYFNWDVMMSALGGAQAIKESGRKLLSFGGQGVPDGLDLVREGKITAASTAETVGWNAYAGMDSVNRFLNKKPPAPEGIGFAVVDQSHGLPPAAGTSWEPPNVNYAADYKKAWSEGKG